MIKKIIALAIAGLVSGAAFAQSNVTVYGVADVGYMHGATDVTPGTAGTKSGIQSGGWGQSRLGFKGEEALGSGIKAIFALEYGLTIDENTGVGSVSSTGLQAREQSVGLSGDFGTVKAGRLVSLGHLAVNKFDPMRASVFAPLSSIRETSISNNSRLSNTVAYMSPNMSGVTLGATYSFNGLIGGATTDTVAAADQERTVGLMADYTEGPLAVAYVYHRVTDAANVAGADSREHFVGGSYDFGVAKLLASWQSDKATFSVAGTPGGTAIVTTPTDEVDRTVWSIGAQIPVSTASRVDVGYASRNDKMAANADITSWGVQYSYDLSKRTMLYGGYQHVSNDNGAKGCALGCAAGITGTGYGVKPTVNDAESTGYGFGIRHSF